MRTSAPRRALTGATGLLAVCTVAAGLSLGTPQAQAREDDPGKLVLVMDSSGSMKEPAGGGRSKISAARAALRTVVRDLPAAQPVGLRVYGATVFSRDQAGACTDSQLEVPVGTGNRRDLLAAAASYRPYGETPIGYALQQAGKDLGQTRRRSIILVSDGVPTCEPDPCPVARELAASGVDLRIDVVGLDVDNSARSVLRCVADAGRGTYYAVADARDLTDSLTRVTTRARRPYGTIGKPVTGADTSTAAPVLTPGDYQDRTNNADERFYLLQRSSPGSTLHFSATVSDADRSSGLLQVKLSNPDGTTCASNGAVRQKALPRLTSVAVVAGPLGSSGDFTPDSPCATAETIVASVSNTGGAGESPVEMRVLELPPVADVDGLPEEPNDPQWVEPPSGPATRVLGGTTFTDAPLLRPGTFRDDIVPGEVLTYQVDLNWGQQLSAEMQVPALSQRRLLAIPGFPQLSLGVFGPVRAAADAVMVEAVCPAPSWDRTAPSWRPWRDRWRSSTRARSSRSCGARTWPVATR